MKAYEGTGLHPYHHAILLVLDAGSAETQGAIADALGYDRGQLVGCSTNWRNRGFIERRRDPERPPSSCRSLTRTGSGRSSGCVRSRKEIEDEYLGSARARRNGRPCTRSCSAWPKRTSRAARSPQPTALAGPGPLARRRRALQRRSAARPAALLEVLLVIVLGLVERLRGLDLRHDRRAPVPLLSRLRLHSSLVLLLVVEEDRGAVVVADVPALAIQLGRVVLRPEDVEQLLVRDALGVVRRPRRPRRVRSCASRRPRTSDSPSCRPRSRRAFASRRRAGEMPPRRPRSSRRRTLPSSPLFLLQIECC